MNLPYAVELSSVTVLYCDIVRLNSCTECSAWKQCSKTEPQRHYPSTYGNYPEQYRNSIQRGQIIIWTLSQRPHTFKGHELPLNTDVLLAKA